MPHVIRVRDEGELVLGVGWWGWRSHLGAQENVALLWVPSHGTMREAQGYRGWMLSSPGQVLPGSV